jgi:hypothetical protein
MTDDTTLVIDVDRSAYAAIHRRLKEGYVRERRGSLPKDGHFLRAIAFEIGGGKEVVFRNCWSKDDEKPQEDAAEPQHHVTKPKYTSRVKGGGVGPGGRAKGDAARPKRGRGNEQPKAALKGARRRNGRRV